MSQLPTMDRTISSTSIGAQLRKIESFQYPASHIGHLSEKQAQALTKFKEIAAQAGIYTPAAGSNKASHDDETLLRYLRARKFVPEEALKQFKDTEQWRKTQKIDEVYKTIDIDDYDETRRLYPQWTGRRDKRGIPVYVFEVAHLNAKRMSAYEKSIAAKTTASNANPKMIRLFALYENLTRFVLPLCSGVPGRPFVETPVSQSNNIVDISGVGLKQFWNLRQHMQDASQLATAHYPETLDRIFIIGAPSFFPTVWSWIKNWFDPITVSKIFILSKNSMKVTLETYIDSANIPRKYGGTLDWEWGTLPSLEPAISKALTWETQTKTSGENAFPTGPVEWEVHGDEMVAVAVGSENGKLRKTRIASMPVPESSGAPVPNRNSLAPPENDPMFGVPSTSGSHTHPTEGQEYFPTSGVTPPEEHDEQTLAEAYNSPDNNSSVPIDRGNNSEVGDHKDLPIRDGTSETKYADQKDTHADGQVKDGTPAVKDHGFGDKTATMEPSTVGQAPKDTQIPQAETEEAPASNGGIFSSVTSVAASAASAATGAGSAVLATVGLGGVKAEQPPATSSEAAPTAQDKAVDSLDKKNVEQFIRSQYASGTEKGN